MKSSTTVSVHALERARGVLLMLADGPRDQAFWRALLGQASAAPELPDGTGVCISGHPLLLSGLAALTKAMGTAPPATSFHNDGSVTVQIDTRATDLWAAAAKLSGDERDALDVLLRRAFDPIEALATWRAEEFFSAAELDGLHATHAHGVTGRPTRLRWVSGKDMVYEGYACAIVKVTRLCNLRCHYCSDWRAGSGNDMPFPVLLALFEQLLGSGKWNTCEVVWHGGEPTILGRNAFLRGLFLQRWFSKPHHRVMNRLQTNGTMINADWVRFLKRYGFSVGVSIDGPSTLHDETRKHADGRPSFDEAMAGINLLRNNDLLSHVYVVVTSETIVLGAAALHRFLQDNGLLNVGLLPERPSTERVTIAGVDRTRYIRFLVEFDRARHASPTPWVNAREIDAVERAISGEMAGHCELLGGCVGTFFSVEPSGVVSHCDKFGQDQDYVLGDLLNSSLETLLQGSKCGDLTRRVLERTVNMTSCPFYRSCRGWCPHEVLLQQKGLARRSLECCGMRELFDEIAGRRHGDHKHQ
jgi:uncharacterized protein